MLYILRDNLRNDCTPTIVFGLNNSQFKYAFEIDISPSELIDISRIQSNKTKINYLSSY